MNPLRLQERLERPPNPLEVEWDYLHHFGTLIKPNQFPWENQLTILTSTRANQCDSMYKVINLEECMNNEFLRPRENRCKWFNKFVNVWRRLYIVRVDKSKISHKNNLVNRFTKWVNRFRQQKTTQECMKYETLQWISESIQVSPWWRMIRFNLQMNRFSASQRVWWDDSYWNEPLQVWYDSRSCESIHLYLET